MKAAELLVPFANKIHFDRKTGMRYFGKMAAEAASLLKVIRAHLDGSSKRADHPLFYRCYSESRHFALMDAVPFKVEEILEEQIKAPEALNYADPSSIENHSEIRQRDMQPPIPNS